MSQEDLPEGAPSPAGAETAITPEPPTQERPAAPAGQGRLSRWLNTGLRWAAGLGVVFVLGVGLVWILRVLPQTQEIRLLRQDQVEAQQKVADLQSQVESLRPLQDENASLKDDLAQTNHHLNLLSVLVDVTSAQLALAQDNPLGAKAALTDTDAKLRELQSEMDSTAAQSIQAIRDRLVLVSGELESDRFAAQRDLEVVANSLLDDEKALFPTPAP